MLKTSARLLQLLSRLQARRAWSGGQLADELEVTRRTVRNDIARLRDLGYPVDASPGLAGGYRLGRGADLPPLLLDDDEAVAVAIGLRSAAAGQITGIEEVSLRALVKLEQVMPARVRRRVRTVQQAVVAVPRSMSMSMSMSTTAPASAVGADTLAAIAGACFEHDRLRFDYRDHGGVSSLRTTEPHRVVHDGRRWYLVAWDVDRTDWRTFRVDRLKPRLPVGPRFAPRDPPGGDLIRHVSRGLQQATWQYKARVKVHTSAAKLSERVPAAITVKAIDDGACVASVGSDSPEMLAIHLGMLGVDFEVVDDAPELRDALRALGRRYLRAARPRSKPGKRKGAR